MNNLPALDGVYTLEKGIRFDSFSTETNRADQLDSLPLLPPRGIFVPTSMIFHMQIPSAALVTWIQIRSLAWRGWSTPPLSISEIASILGIHPARLGRHLSQLESISALSIRSNGNGKIIIAFPIEPLVMPEYQAVMSDDTNSQGIRSPQAESPGAPSYFPDQILGYLTY